MLHKIENNEKSIKTCPTGSIWSIPSPCVTFSKYICCAQIAYRNVAFGHPHSNHIADLNSLSSLAKFRNI